MHGERCALKHFLFFRI